MSVLAEKPGMPILKRSAWITGLITSKLAALLVLVPLPIAWFVKRLLDGLGHGMGGTSSGDPVQDLLMTGGTVLVGLGLVASLVAPRIRLTLLSALIGLLGMGAAWGAYSGVEAWRHHVRQELYDARRRDADAHADAVPFDYRTSDEPRARRYLWEGDILLAISWSGSFLTPVGRRVGDRFELWRIGRSRRYESTRRDLESARGPDGRTLTDTYTIEVVCLEDHPDPEALVPGFWQLQETLRWSTPPHLRQVEYRYPRLRL